MSRENKKFKYHRLLFSWARVIEWCQNPNIDFGYFPQINAPNNHKMVWKAFHKYYKIWQNSNKTKRNNWCWETFSFFSSCYKQYQKNCLNRAKRISNGNFDMKWKKKKKYFQIIRYDIESVVYICHWEAVDSEFGPIQLLLPSLSKVDKWNLEKVFLEFWLFLWEQKKNIELLSTLKWALWQWKMEYQKNMRHR